MKNLFLLSFILLTLTSPLTSQATVVTDNVAIDNISRLDFFDRIFLQITAGPDARTIVVHRCEIVEKAFSNEHTKYQVISPIYHCAVNLAAWKVNQFFFFTEGGKTYLRQIKLMESISYNVEEIRGSKVYLGQQYEQNFVGSDRGYPKL